MKPIYIIAIMMAMSVGSMAQRRINVADLETRQLLSNVQIRTDIGDTLRTAWDGSAILPDTSRYNSIVLSHPLYRTRNVKRSELTDTVYVMACDKLLGEVVIYGKRIHHDIPMKFNPVDMQLENINPADGVNLLGLFYDAATKIFHINLDKKNARKERRKMILDNY